MLVIRVSALSKIIGTRFLEIYPISCIHIYICTLIIRHTVFLSNFRRQNVQNGMFMFVKHGQNIAMLFDCSGIRNYWQSQAWKDEKGKSAQTWPAHFFLRTRVCFLRNIHRVKKMIAKHRLASKHRLTRKEYEEDEEEEECMRDGSQMRRLRSLPFAKKNKHHHFVGSSSFCAVISLSLLAGSRTERDKRRHLKEKNTGRWLSVNI